MHPNALLLETFYAAFARRDPAAMAACYHPEARFSDPVFPALAGQGVCAMWAMLCESGKDLRVESSAIAADDAQGSAHWDAHYTFKSADRRCGHSLCSPGRFRWSRVN